MYIFCVGLSEMSRTLRKHCSWIWLTNNLRRWRRFERYSFGKSRNLNTFKKCGTTCFNNCGKSNLKLRGRPLIWRQWACTYSCAWYVSRFWGPSCVFWAPTARLWCSLVFLAPRKKMLFVLFSVGFLLLLFPQPSLGVGVCMVSHSIDILMQFLLFNAAVDALLRNASAPLVDLLVSWWGCVDSTSNNGWCR